MAGTSASAAVVLSSVDGPSPDYNPPSVTYDFAAPDPDFTGGTLRTGSVEGQAAKPYGITGSYASVGPNDGPGVLNLAEFADINAISLIWGSIDNYNILEIFGTGGVLLRTITGLDVFATASGNQTAPQQNRLVTLTFTDGDQSKVDKLVFRSNQAAFEFGKISVAAVPEPTTWMLMMLGMAGIGFSMRRKKDTTLRVRYA